MVGRHRSETAERVMVIVESFVTDQNIHCSETIYQTDRVIENAYEFVERLCDAAGYAPSDDDDEEE